MVQTARKIYISFAFVCEEEGGAGGEHNTATLTSFRLEGQLLIQYVSEESSFLIHNFQIPIIDERPIYIHQTLRHDGRFCNN